MSTPTVDELFGYIQERCLWQFFSRSWDRTQNIEGILGQVSDLLAGTQPPLATPMDHLFYADARILVDAIRNRFPTIGTLTPEEVRALMAKLKEQVTDVAITRSRNRELHQKLY